MGVVQRADESFFHKIGSFIAPMISTIYNLPNIFEMSQFTSCVCLVFNQAGKSIVEIQQMSGDYRKTFEDVHKKWKAGGEGRFFRAMCPYEEDGVTQSREFRTFCQACLLSPETLGSNPLIVVIGHCSPGSAYIHGDTGTGLKFPVTKVLEVIRPLMIKNCTIVLTPCSTALSKGESSSFQDQLLLEMTDETNPAPGAYLIGMNSTSVPVAGTVLSTGYTFKHSGGGSMTFEQFKSLQEHRT